MCEEQLDEKENICHPLYLKRWLYIIILTDIAALNPENIPEITYTEMKPSEKWRSEM